MKTEHFKEKLEEEKKKLESELSGIGQRNPAVTNDWEAAPEELGIEPDLMDQADIVVNRENTAAILADLEARYDLVLAALAKIEKGTYGVCEVCGSQIEEMRLEADPSATTCVEHL
jgi:RNA polymerase-binding transcription factor DksA